METGSSSDAADDTQPERRGAAYRRAGPLTQALRPFTRTGGFYARSWGRYLNGGPELPMARPTMMLAAQAFFDEVVLAGFRSGPPLSTNPDAVADAREAVIAATALYEQRGWLQNPEGFFATPPPLTDITVRPVHSRGRSYERIAFASGYEPHDGEPGRERWLGYTANSRVYGLMLRHPEPRPWLVCVHGAQMGRAAIDLALFRAWQLHDDLGLNVVLPVLPMHGPRGRGLPPGAAFPGRNLLDDVHAAAQSVWDIRRMLSWIRSRQPDSPIGLNGLSLGGYVSALVAELYEGLTCAILGVPVVNLVKLIDRHAGLGRNDPRREVLRLAKPIGQMVSPLALTPRLPLRGRFIYAGVADRLVHPREQVTKLWEHWGRPEIIWYEGGHVGFFRSRPVQQFVQNALVQSGLVEAERIGRNR
ncbi:alpha/beta hydrolase family protein [Mycobacterium sp.]|uniref:alpha/beta hydrolase family protein n=1 Tax=Mycobacterium sp. TaxID=1785 RepID=UPI003BAB1EF8